MNTSVLLRKLIELEHAIGVETESTIRHRVLDAQDCLINLQRQNINHLRACAACVAPQRFSLLREFTGHPSGDLS